MDVRDVPEAAFADAPCPIPGCGRPHIAIPDCDGIIAHLMLEHELPYDRALIVEGEIHPIVYGLARGFLDMGPEAEEALARALEQMA